MKQDVNVSNGLFNVGLDFGTIAFKGDARWLEIGVRPGSSTGSFTVLSPLQPVKPTPYAVYAPSAGTATAAPWSGLTGVPSGFSDNTDNNTTYTAGSGLTLTGTQFGVNTNAVQARVTGVCPTGEAIRVVSSNGTVQCQKETDPKVGSIATNAVPKWDGTRLITGTWVDNGGKVSIGPAGPAAKLSVRINDPQIQNAGVFINENDAGSTETGVFAAAYGIGGTQHTGLFGQAEGGSHNRGVWGDARQDIGFPDFNYGGYFTAIGAVNNYAVWAESGDVYVRDQVGIGDPSPDAKLDVESNSSVEDGIRINNTNTSTSGGDPIVDFEIEGVRKFTMGVDKSDANKFKIGTSSLTASTTLTIQPGLVGIGDSSPDALLDLQSFAPTTAMYINNIFGDGDPIRILS